MLNLVCLNTVGFLLIAAIFSFFEFTFHIETNRLFEWAISICSLEISSVEIVIPNNSIFNATSKPISNDGG